MKVRRNATGAALVLSALLGGCGLSAPPIQELWDGEDGAKEIEFGIKRRVYCDLKRGLAKVNSDPSYRFGILDRNSGKITWKQLVPNDWGALVSLSLQVDENSSVNPGATVNEVLHSTVTRFPNGNVVTPQSFSLGFGGTLSATASRTDKFDAYYPVSHLMIPDSKDSICLSENDIFKGKGSKSSPLIVSNLGIEKWIADAMFTNSLLPSVEPSGAAKTPDTITYEAKFVIVTNGSVNPVWKLVRFSGNTGSPPLFGAGRTRTHSLIITLGPRKGETGQTHFASQIGQSIAAGYRSSLGQ